MKKLTWSLLFALVSSTAIAQNSTPAPVADSEGKYNISVGQLTMTIDAQRGAKILSLKYGEQEVISQSRFPESFGSTFWTSPQKEWNWPPVQEYDKGAYSVEQKDGRLVMTSQVSPRLKFRIRKEFATDESKKAIVVSYSIINEDSIVRKVAPWEITRVPNEGLIFFKAPLESVTPAGLLTLEEAQGALWYRTDEVNQNRKINADGEGWLAYANNGLLLIKHFDDLQSGQPAPEEAEVQVYVNRGKTYIELESQGAYTTLAPGEQLTWTVRWQLKPFKGEAAPSKELIRLIKD